MWRGKGKGENAVGDGHGPEEAGGGGKRQEDKGKVRR